MLHIWSAERNVVRRVVEAEIKSNSTGNSEGRTSAIFQAGDLPRARVAHDPRSPSCGQQIVFGMGAEERVLEPNNEPAFLSLIRSIGEVRHSDGPGDHMLFRMQPERWLESLVVTDISQIDERLDPTSLYSQVPAFSACDGAMISVLAVTHAGRLAVIELKAE